MQVPSEDWHPSKFGHPTILTLVAIENWIRVPGTTHPWSWASDPWDHVRHPASPGPWNHLRPHWNTAYWISTCVHLNYLRHCTASEVIEWTDVEDAWVDSGIKRRSIQVDSGRFRSIRDFSTALPLTDDLGIYGKYKYAWVDSAQPPQPYIILIGAREHREGGWEVE